MVIDFECNNCNGDFEVDVDELIEDEKAIKCPHCKAKLDGKTSEELAAILEDLMSLMAAMSKKFKISMAIETDDLPSSIVDDDEDEAGDDDDLDLDDDELEEVDEEDE